MVTSAWLKIEKLMNELKYLELNEKKNERGDLKYVFRKRIVWFYGEVFQANQEWFVLSLFMIERYFADWKLIKTFASHRLML